MSRIERALESALKKRNEEPVNGDRDSETHPEEVRSGEYDVFEDVPAPQIKCPFLPTATDPKSPAAEQFRKLKSSLVKLAQLGRFDKSLMVTSSVGGEGKSITSLNLAITLAQEFDHSVLLVEADIRRPTILKYLGMEAVVGLADCVLDGLDVGDVLIKSGIGKLSILPAGRMVDNPVELFSSNRMKTLLEEIKNRYSDRYIIVDTTPVLPFAEPQFIANVVGGVLFVVREGYTPIEKAKSALDLLKNHNLLGVVYNEVAHAAAKDGYYGYYGYYGYK